MAPMMGNARAIRTSQMQPAPWVLDLLLGIGVALTVSLFIAADVDQTDPDGWAYLWAVALGALMLARRRHPVIVVVLSLAAVIAYYVAGYPPIGVAVPLAAAVFSAAEYRHVPTAVIASAFWILMSVAYRLAVGQDPAFVVGYELPGNALLLAGAIALGDSVRGRRESRRQAAEIAALTADRLERESAQRAMSERLAIARELHDSVGHALTVITLHAQVAEEALGTDDGEVQRSLAVISDTTAATFADLRQTVAGLRRQDETSRSPLRIADLDAALLPARHAGLQVRTEVDVHSTLAPHLEAAIYRIVQESVTNIVQHADASHVDVQIAEGAGMVTVSVVNDDRGAPRADPQASPRRGNGIPGMRERAQLLGGTLAAGAHGSDFAVRASIPLEVPA